MIMCKLHLSILCSLLFTVIQAIGQPADRATYQKTDHGVMISFAGLPTSVDQDIYLDAIRDDIVRVTALPINVPFPTRESFIVVDSLHRLIHSLSVERSEERRVG